MAPVDSPADRAELRRAIDGKTIAGEKRTSSDAANVLKACKVVKKYGPGKWHIELEDKSVHQSPTALVLALLGGRPRGTGEACACPMPDPLASKVL